MEKNHARAKLRHHLIRLTSYQKLVSVVTVLSYERFLVLAIIAFALIAVCIGLAAGFYLHWIVLIAVTCLATFLLFFGARNIRHGTIGLAYSLTWLPAYFVFNTVMWITWFVKTCGPYILKHMP